MQSTVSGAILVHTDTHSILKVVVCRATQELVMELYDINVPPSDPSAGSGDLVEEGHKPTVCIRNQTRQTHIMLLIWLEAVCCLGNQ